MLVEISVVGYAIDREGAVSDAIGITTYTFRGQWAILLAYHLDTQRREDNNYYTDAARTGMLFINIRTWYSIHVRMQLALGIESESATKM